MDEVLIGKLKNLIKAIEKALPHIRNRQLSRELKYRSIEVINEIKSISKEKKDVGKKEN